MALLATACTIEGATGPGDAPPSNPATGSVPPAPAPPPPPAPPADVPPAPVPAPPPAPAPPAPAPPINGAVPAAVAGNWRYGSVSPSNFYNDHTGAYSGNAYGFSRHYTFFADGSYKDYVYIYAESYGCRQQNWVEMSGTVQFTGADFTTTVTSGRFKTVDSCSASNDRDRPMTAGERSARSTTAAYALRTDANGKAYLTILDGRFDRVR
jgi:hypothetical protein